MVCVGLFLEDKGTSPGTASIPLQARGKVNKGTLSHWLDLRGLKKQKYMYLCSQLNLYKVITRFREDILVSGNETFQRAPCYCLPPQVWSHAPTQPPLAPPSPLWPPTPAPISHTPLRLRVADLRCSLLTCRGMHQQTR